MVDFSRRVSPTMSPVNVARRYNGRATLRPFGIGHEVIQKQGKPSIKMVDDLALLIIILCLMDGRLF